jgi:hypothetical protein
MAVEGRKGENQSICSECGRLAEEEARAGAAMDAARDALDGFVYVGV